MVADFVNIIPSELTFAFELKKQISSSLRLFNTTDDYVAYKVKTTSPKKYCVRPNTGVIAPKGNADILVIMQAQREAPPDMVCRDKFLVQSVLISNASTDVTQEMFNKEEGKEIQELKLRVVYAPPRPPSPVPESNEEGGSPSAEPTSSPSPSINAAVSRSHSDVSDSTAENAAAVVKNITDVSVLRSRLEEAMKTTHALTIERNGFKKENEHLLQELSKSKSELSSKITSAVNASREVTDAHRKSQIVTQKKSGWSTFTLLLIAILFFLCGYFVAVSNVIAS